PVAEDFRPVALTSDERVVLRDATVIVQTDDRSGVVAGVLRPIALPPLTGADEHHSSAVEDDPGSEVLSPFVSVLGDEQVFEAGEPCPVEARACECGGTTPVAGLGVGEVDVLIFGEARMQRDVQQSALAGCAYLGTAGHGIGLEHA